MDVELIPFTEGHREAFFQEEVASYADQQVRDAGWPDHEALARARAELTPVLEREYTEAVEQGDQLWTAIGTAGRHVGWLWVKRIGDPASRVAFLYQLTVAQACRRQGYGRAMLAALEQLLVRDGIEELRLNVFIANEPARRLYASAGYEQVGQDDRRVRLRKRLGRPE